MYPIRVKLSAKRITNRLLEFALQSDKELKNKPITIMPYRIEHDTTSDIVSCEAVTRVLDDTRTNTTKPQRGEGRTKKHHFDHTIFSRAKKTNFYKKITSF